MIEQVLLEALEISVLNPDAIEALARIEFALADSFASPARLQTLVDAWGDRLRGETDEASRIKEKLKAAIATRDNSKPSSTPPEGSKRS